MAKPQDIPRLTKSASLLTTIFSMGEPLPITHLGELPHVLFERWNSVWKIPQLILAYKPWTKPRIEVARIKTANLKVFSTISNVDLYLIPETLSCRRLEVRNQPTNTSIIDPSSG